MGGHYQELQPGPQGWLWSQQLELYLGIYQEKLRFFTSQGQLIPTPEEETVAEQQRVAEIEALLVRYQERFGELPDQ